MEKRKSGEHLNRVLAAAGVVPLAVYCGWLAARFGGFTAVGAAMVALAVAGLGLLAVRLQHLMLRCLGSASRASWTMPLAAGWLALAGFCISGTGGSFRNIIGGHKYVLLTVWALALLAAAAQWALVLRDGGAARRGLIAGGAALLFYLAAYPAIRLHDVHGDEPYYLWMSRSIVADGDLDLTNNVPAWLHERLVVFPVTDGSQRLYAGYLPAYAALLTPGYALAGDNGAVLLQMFISALLAAQLYLLLTEAGGARAGWPGWLTVAATAPLAVLSAHIYPETLAALLVTMVLRRMLLPIGTRVEPTALYIGALVWLHPRYAYLAVVLGAALLWRQRRTRVAIVMAVLVMLMLAGGAWLHRRSLTPDGHSGDQSVLRVTMLPSQVARFFIDQEYGLCFIAPVYLLLPAAVAVAWRSRMPVTRLACALLAVFCLFHGLFAIWGVGSVSGRYLTPLMPALALLMTGLWSAAGPRLRRGLALLLALSIGIALLQAIAPVFRFERADGVNRLLGMLCPPLTQWLPSLVHAGTHFSLPLDAVAYAWLAAVLVGNGWVLWRMRAGRK